MGDPDSTPASTGSDLDTHDAPVYGGYVLRRGAYDDIGTTDPPETLVEGRHEAEAIPWSPAPDGNGAPQAPAEPTIQVDVRPSIEERLQVDGYVRRLQMDLQTLGFRMIREDDGRFGRYTEWAVREFQIYAGMDRVARETDSEAEEYVQRLEAVRADDTDYEPYDGPISGVVNEATARRLAHWMEHAWRCPVVITARTGEGYANVYGGEMTEGADPANLWRHDDVQTKTPRMFVTDFTEHYNVFGSLDIQDGFENIEGINAMVLGYYQAEVERYPGGPNMEPDKHTWDASRMTPERLVGTPTENLSAEQVSTFKVSWNAVEEECYGYFDIVNAWDANTVSLPPFHYTLGQPGNEPVEGELGGLLAYVRHDNPDTFRSSIGIFGIRPARFWPEGGETPQVHHRQGKYESAIEYRTSAEEEFDTVSPSSEEQNYFRSWHWFYRWVMTGRAFEEWRQSLWEMIRIRLRDVREAQVGNRYDGWSQDTTVGDIFTSEVANAILLRWHAHWPNSIIDHGNDPGTTISNAIAEAIRSSVSAGELRESEWKEVQVDRWGDRHEEALIAALTEETSTIPDEPGENINSAIQTIRGAEYQIPFLEQGISSQRGSFQFDRP